jgi:hypothetical protein
MCLLIIPLRLFTEIVEKTEVFNMNQETRFQTCEGVEVAESPLLRAERSNPYGSVPGLDDEELLDAAELERLYIQQEFGPVLALPEPKARKGWMRPNIDEDGKVDWGAFGTVDFDRYRPNFDKRLYKADKLKEEFAEQILAIEMISARIKTPAKYKVIEYVNNGILDLDHVSDFDMYCLARRYLRARRLQREIAELKEKSWRQRQERAAKFLTSL